MVNRQYLGIIFDLDGVIVSTDDCHYRAWKKMADEEGVYFDRQINERLRGVSRMESLEIILEKSAKVYTQTEKLQLAERKNNYYKQIITELDPSAILEGALAFIMKMKEWGLKVAIGSSSKNTALILKQIQCDSLFDAVADGNEIVHSKPAPDVFLKAAEKLGLSPDVCIVMEDADAGIEAALRAGMHVIGVGPASRNENATYHADGLQDGSLLQIFESAAQ